jgi:hypothetical protein
VGKFVFIVLVSYGKFLMSSDDFYLDSSLVQGLIRVKFLTFCLGSRRWFVLCLAFIPYLDAGTGVKYKSLKLGGGQAYDRSSD